MKVAIVGANGLIGRALGAALVARGDSVVALSRGGVSGIAGALDMRWDPAEGPPPQAALAGGDAVVNLAGVPIGGKRWTSDRKREIRESRTLTTRHLVDAMAGDGGPRVLVNGSAVGYYGPTEETVDETAPAGADFLADTCVAWEREAERARASGVRVVLVRTGIVLARDGGALPQMAMPVRFFAGGPIGGGRHWIPWIHIDDEVGLLMLALDSEGLRGPMNGTAPEPARQRDFVKALAKAVGRPAVLPTPAFPLRIAMGEMATLALDGQRAVPAVALAAGYDFVHPELEAALRAVYH